MKLGRILFHIAIVICITVFFGELITRIFFPRQDAMRWLQPDERYGYTLVKNFYGKHRFSGTDFIMEVKINSLGLRDKEYNISDLSDPVVKKFLLLGDSYTFGHGVNMEDTFDYKLETLLNRNGDFIVLNSGVGGWGTLQEMSYAKDNFSLFNPDIIVLTFCGNDPGDDIFFKEGLSNSKEGILGYFPGKDFIRNHSHFYRFLSKKFRILFHNWLLNKKRTQHPQSEIDVQSASLITEVEWSRSLDLIKRFHNDFLKFNPNGILLVQASNPIDTSIRKNLSRLSNGKNLFYVDLYNDVIVLPLEQRRLPYDGHWSREMHMTSVKNLYKTLLEVNAVSSK